MYVFATAKGSPGLTTTLLLLAGYWPAHREPLIIELDPAGGDLVARLASLDGRSALARKPSTHQLAAESATGVTWQSVLSHTQHLPGPGEIRALVAPASPFASSSAAEQLVSNGLLRALTELHRHDVLVDLGRLDVTSPVMPLVRRLSTVVLVARSTLESLDHTAELANSLRASGVTPQLLLIGDGPYDANQAVELCGGVDPPAAAVINGEHPSRRRLDRSHLAGAARDITRRMAPIEPASTQPDPQMPASPAKPVAARVVNLRHAQDAEEAIGWR
jgi:hypothetical protein